MHRASQTHALFFVSVLPKNLHRALRYVPRRIHLLLTYRTLRQDAIPLFQLFVSDGENELKQVNS